MRTLVLYFVIYSICQFLKILKFILLHCFSGACFEMASQVPTAISPVVSNIASTYLCQNECQRRADCFKFVYDSSTKNCYVNYQTPGTKVVLKNAVMGPRSCGYNNYLGKQTKNPILLKMKSKWRILEKV